MLLPLAHGVRFAIVNASEVIQRVVLESVDGERRGVRRLREDDRTALAECYLRLQGAAAQAIRDREAAKQVAQRAREAAKRVAGRSDLSALTVPLMQEELRTRKQRGEAIVQSGDSNQTQTPFDAAGLIH